MVGVEWQGGDTSVEIQYARSIVGFVFLGDNYYICRIKKKEEKILFLQTIREVRRFEKLLGDRLKEFYIY